MSRREKPTLRMPNKATKALIESPYHADDPLGEMTVTTSIALPRALKAWAEDLARANRRAGKGEATVSALVRKLLEQHQEKIKKRSGG